MAPRASATPRLRRGQLDPLGGRGEAEGIIERN